MSPTVVSIASRSRFLQSKYRLIEGMGGEFVVNRLRALRTLRVTVGFAVRRKPSSAEPVERIAVFADCFPRSCPGARRASGTLSTGDASSALRRVALRARAFGHRNLCQQIPKTPESLFGHDRALVVRRTSVLHPRTLRANPVDRLDNSPLWDGGVSVDQPANHTGASHGLPPVRTRQMAFTSDYLRKRPFDAANDQYSSGSECGEYDE